MMILVRLAAVLLLMLMAAAVVSAAEPEKLPNITAEVVASDLGFVSAFNFHKDGRVFVLTLSDRSISTIELPYPQSGVKTLWYKFTDIIATANAGPFGIAFDPEYATNKQVYVYVAGRNVSGAVVNQVIKFKDVKGVATEPKVILTIPTIGAIAQEGGYLDFGPDGKLWLVVGQGTIEGNPALQDINSLHGKILRINKDGSIPKSNPFPDSPVWAWGIRNSFGFDWDPVKPLDLHIWEGENGENCNDEINYIGKKNNLGYGPIRNCTQPWTVQKTNSNGDNVVLPKFVLNAVPPALRSPSPTGLTFCNKCKLTKWLNRHMLVSYYVSWDIRAYKLNGARDAISKEYILYKNDASIIGLRVGPPRKTVYFSDFKAGRNSLIKKLVVNK